MARKQKSVLIENFFAKSFGVFFQWFDEEKIVFRVTSPCLRSPTVCQPSLCLPQTPPENKEQLLLLRPLM